MTNVVAVVVTVLVGGLQRLLLMVAPLPPLLLMVAPLPARQAAILVAPCVSGDDIDK